MSSNIPLLQNVRIAAPCHESWADMTPVDGDRVRHCGNCQLNVYNLSALTQAEAEGLLRRHEGRLCVRYYQRQDGSVLTRNCPVGAHAARLLLIRQSLVAAVLLVAAAGAALQPSPTMGHPSYSAVTGGPAMPETVGDAVGKVALTGQVLIDAPVMGTPAMPETVGKIALTPPPAHVTAPKFRPTMGVYRSEPVEKSGEASTPK